MGNKIALCVIVKPDKNEAKLLYRLFAHENLYKMVDGIFVTITGKKGQSVECENIIKEAGGNISYFKWVNDFAKARNFNFSQPGKEYDWIMWADADDIVLGVENIRNVVNNYSKTQEVEALAWDYLYDFDEY